LTYLKNLNPGENARKKHDPVSTGGKIMKIFCSYSHLDKKHYEQLVAFLSVLETEGLISTWSFEEIPPGTEWNRVIQEHLNEAELILLLVHCNI
jgi:hypothetical protein